jgi:hypothetical protein
MRRSPTWSSACAAVMYPTACADIHTKANGLLNGTMLTTRMDRLNVFVIQVRLLHSQFSRRSSFFAFNDLSGSIGLKPSDFMSKMEGVYAALVRDITLSLSSTVP